MSAKKIGGLVCGVVLVVVVIAALRRGAVGPATPGPNTESPESAATSSKPVAPKHISSDPERRRQTLERLQGFVASFRRHQDGIQAAWNGRTDEEKARRVEELNDLRLEAENHLKELKDHAADFEPAAVLEFLGTADGRFARMRLAPVIAAVLDLGITSEDSPGGPLMEGLLPLAQGAAPDQLFLLTVAKEMRLANREIGEACFTALGDAGWKTREQALEALREQASRGNLRETITRNAPALQKLAWEASDESLQVKLSAFESLVVVETPEMDEFLVQQVEASAEPDQMLQRLDILAESAPRILQSHSHRLAAAVKTAADQPAELALHYRIVRVAAHLPRAVGLEALRYLSSRLPADHVKQAQGLDLIIQKIDRGESADLVAELEKLHPLEKGQFFLSLIGTPKSARGPGVTRPQ